MRLLDPRLLDSIPAPPSPASLELLATLREVDKRPNLFCRTLIDRALRNDPPADVLRFATDVLIPHVFQKLELRFRWQLCMVALAALPADGKCLVTDLAVDLLERTHQCFDKTEVLRLTAIVLARRSVPSLRAGIVDLLRSGQYASLDPDGRMVLTTILCGQRSVAPFLQADAAPAVLQMLVEGMAPPLQVADSFLRRVIQVEVGYLAYHRRTLPRLMILAERQETLHFVAEYVLAAGTIFILSCARSNIRKGPMRRFLYLLGTRYKIGKEVRALWPEYVASFLGGDTAPGPRERERVGSEKEGECCLTLEPFKDPVLASDGNTYERNAILTHLTLKATSPLTRERLSSRLISV